MASWDLWGIVAHDAGGGEDAEGGKEDVDGVGRVIGALTPGVGGGVELTALVEAIALCSLAIVKLFL